MTGLKRLAAIGVLAAGCAGAAPAAHQWRDYTNVRFGYATCYPADLLTAQPEAPNSDGRQFTGRDGAKLIVYGSNNALGTPVAQAADDTAKRLAGDGGTTSYRAVKPSWFVVSGSGPGGEFYAKSIYAASQIKAFELTYPAVAKATWGPVAGRLNACFHSLK